MVKARIQAAILSRANAAPPEPQRGARAIYTEEECLQNKRLNDRKRRDQRAGAGGFWCGPEPRSLTPSTCAIIEYELRKLVGADG